MSRFRPAPAPVPFFAWLMRHLAFAALLLALVGCGKKQPPEPATGGNPEPTPAPAGDNVARSRAHWLGNLKSSNPKTRQEAVDELAVWAETDPETVAALLELLKDMTTAGLGRTNPTQITSVREAAATALFKAGPKGEAALKEKGLVVLKDGLTDPQPAVREHTAFTLGQLGPLARPLSADVMKLCTSPDEAVRTAAFEALRTIGVTDVAGFAALLTNRNPDVARLAADAVAGLPDIPDAAVPALAAALGSDDPAIRTGAAAGLLTAGPRAAAAAGPLAEAIKKTRAYAGSYSPTKEYSRGPEMVFWRALARIGEPAAAPTAALLAHENALVRGFAATTLGEIGPPAKPAADKLKDALKDRFGFVAVEAACALCRIGEGKYEAVEFVKQAMDAPNSAAQTAIEAIPRMGEAGKPLVPAALAKLNSENPFARYAAANLVATLPLDEATKAAADLGKLTTDREGDIRMRAGAVLEYLGPAGAPAANALAKAIPGEKKDVIRDQFVDALLAMGPGAKPAVPVLLPLVNEKGIPAERRAKVIAAVASADPASKEVAEALITAAADADHVIRSVAATALGRLDPLPPDALAKLVSLAKTDSRTPPRVAAIKALAAAGPRAKGAKPDLEAIAAGPQPGLALLAKVALAGTDGNISAAAPAIRTGLTDKNAQAREAAAQALLVIGPAADDLPSLLRLLKDANATTQEAAARCIGRLGPAAKDAMPQLVTLLGSKEGNVQLAAVEALAELGPTAKAAEGKLQELAGTAASDPVTGTAARRALEKIGGAEKK